MQYGVERILTEEKAIEKAIINDDEDIWAKLAALGMGNEENNEEEKEEETVNIGKTDDSEVDVKIDEGISIYNKDMDFYTALFRQLESDHLIKPGNVTIEGNVVNVTNTEELDQVLFDVPVEAKPRRGMRYHLSTNKEDVLEAIEQARVVDNNQNNTDGIRWADTQILYNLHPVVRYMLTKLSASVPKNDAPVAKLSILPENMVYFVVNGQVSNQLGNSVISDFLVCPVSKDGSGIHKPIPLAEFIDTYHLKDTLYTDTISQADLDCIHRLLPEAIDNILDVMTKQQATKMAAMNSVVNDYSKKLQRWIDGEQQQLNLFEAEELMPRGFAGVRIDNRKKKVQSLSDDRGQYLKDLQSLQGEPFIKVLAAFYNF